MKTLLLLLFTGTSLLAQTSTQRLKDEAADAAQMFLTSLSPEQRKKATYPFGDEERFNWHFVPRTRNGLPLKQMNPDQRKAAMAVLKTGLSEEGYRKVTEIIDLENVLRVVENRSTTDLYRDPENYAFTIFGEPEKTEPWGWRMEGHHLSMQFSSLTGRVVGLTPLFLGSNPAEVRVEVPQKGRRVLKEETDVAFALLKTLSADQQKGAVLNPVAYPDIITGNKRRASLEKMEGLTLKEMTAAQRKLFLELVQVYLNRYRLTLARQQFDKLEKAGLDSLRFAWAGDLTPQLGAGKGYYYRIHGPTILIEYDNTQTNANHVHTIVRDLTNDFGEDLLKAHYERKH